MNEFKEISLSPDTITGKIDELASNINDQLIDKISGSFYVSLAIDEITNISDVAQLAVVIHMVRRNLKIIEGLLKLMQTHDTTKADHICDKTEIMFVEENLFWLQFACLLTDSVSVMASSKTRCCWKDKKVAQ